jgi:poly-gamma-glutamate synthesis protein (capsule biosynthesis protein)
VRAGPLRVGIAAFTDTEPGWAAGPGSAREGVDLIHGHSAHIFQGIEVHRGKPILYDTGDALDDYAVDPVLRNDRSFVFLADVEGSRVRALRLLPILLQGTRAGLARGRDFEETCRRMQVLSAETGTRARPAPHGLTIEIPAAGV